MNNRLIIKKLVVAFSPLYIIAGILNFCSIDFCDNNHPDFLVVFSSFGTYILFTIITEMEVFLVRDSIHLQLCLLFWVIHLFVMIIGTFFQNFGLILFLFVISPSIGIINTFTGEGKMFIFPFLCFIEAMQLAALLLWDKYAKRRS